MGRHGRTSVSSPAALAQATNDRIAKEKGAALWHGVTADPYGNCSIKDIKSRSTTISVPNLIYYIFVYTICMYTYIYIYIFMCILYYYIYSTIRCIFPRGQPWNHQDPGAAVDVAAAAAGACHDAGDAEGEVPRNWIED
jgi:hypothetical protein